MPVLRPVCTSQSRIYQSPTAGKRGRFYPTEVRAIQPQRHKAVSACAHSGRIAPAPHNKSSRRNRLPLSSRPSVAAQQAQSAAMRGCPKGVPAPRQPSARFPVQRQSIRRHRLFSCALRFSQSIAVARPKTSPIAGMAGAPPLAAARGSSSRLAPPAKHQHSAGSNKPPFPAHTRPLFLVRSM